jgi:hypothetical protein
VQALRARGRVSLRADLRHADRAYWPSLLSAWRHERSTVVRGRVLFAGPVTAMHGFGVPSASAGWIQRSCGDAVLRSTTAVVVGPRRAAALQIGYYFVRRGVKPLLYFAY